MGKRLIAFGIAALMIISLLSCGGGGGGGGVVLTTHTVTYDGNGNTGGSVPVDETAYTTGQEVTLPGNPGNLVKAGYSFVGWSTEPGGSGMYWSEGSTFNMGTENIVLYARWSSNPTYTVTYNGNSNSGGIVPVDTSNYEQGQDVIVKGNTGNLVKVGYVFSGWSPNADGSGPVWSQGSIFTMGAGNVVLYARWTSNYTSTYRVTYDGNGNTGGIVPVDTTNYEETLQVTVLGNTGNLVKDGYVFAGWNTQQNGGGNGYSGGHTFPMGSSNVTLYAQWTAVPTYTVTYDGNGSMGGTVPIDSNAYHYGDLVLVPGNTGNLSKDDYTFVGWNTQQDGNGDSYSEGHQFSMGYSNVTLHAQWTTSTYTIGGTVSGLTGALVVRNNDTDDLTITSDGTFRFATALATGSTYTVSVKTNPVSQRCTITDSSGSLNGTDVSNVAINCTTHNIVFVTSTGQTGNLGGLAGADAICATRASNAGLPGTYVAWLSTSTVNAKARLGSARGWIRPDSLPFADTVDDLTSGKIFYPPRLDEFGNDVGKQKIAFTGTTYEGVLNTTSGSTTCQDWTTAAPSDWVAGGGPDGGTMVWTHHYTTYCSVQQRLYCFGKDYSNPLAPFSVAGRLAFASNIAFVSGGGIAAADTLCQTQANSAGLSGSYKALLATESASAASRFSTTGATWVRRDGVAVVGKASDIATDLLLAPINVSAGGTYMENYGIWVGANSLSDVGSGSTCSSWNSTSGTAIGANAASSGMGWQGTASCSATYLRLWCLQE